MNYWKSLELSTIQSQIEKTQLRGKGWGSLREGSISNRFSFFRIFQFSIFNFKLLFFNFIFLFSNSISNRFSFFRIFQFSIFDFILTNSFNLLSLIFIQQLNNQRHVFVGIIEFGIWDLIAANWLLWTCRFKALKMCFGWQTFITF